MRDLILKVSVSVDRGVSDEVIAEHVAEAIGDYHAEDFSIFVTDVLVEREVK
jgi:hypothetical protein